MEFTYSLELIGLLAQQVLEEGVRVHVSLLQPTADVVECLFGAVPLEFIRKGEAFAGFELFELLVFVGGELLADCFLDGCVFFSRFLEGLVSAVLHHKVGLGDHPVSRPGVWQHLVVVDGHLSDEFVLCLGLFLGFGIRLVDLGLDMAKSLLEALPFSFEFDDKVILKRVLQEQAASHGVDRLLVHLFDLFNVGAECHLICGLDQADRGQDELRAHLLDGLRDLPLHVGGKARLIPVVQLAGVVDELRHQWSVVVVDIALPDRPHQLLPELLP